MQNILSILNEETHNSHIEYAITHFDLYEGNDDLNYSQPGNRENMEIYS